MFSRINRMYLLDKNSLRIFSLKQPTVTFCSRESEEYFLNLQLTKHNKTKNKGNTPIKKILATSNKAMFGPLLETSKEKRQRLKYEALGKEIPKKAQKRQFERRMKEENYESLLDKPENSHLLGFFNGNQTPKNIISQESSKNENLDLNGKYFKKLPRRVIVANCNYTTKSKPNLKKLTFLPQEDNNYYNQRKVPIQKKENFSNETQRRNKIVFRNDLNSLSQHAKKILVNNSAMEDYSQIYDNELLRDSTEDNKDKGSQEFFRYNNASQITINNSKWAAAPKIINLDELSKSPLVPSNYLPQQKDDDFVKTIGIFEGGYKKLPSVTKILDETMPLSSRIALDKWKAKMVAELGEQGFAAYQQNILDTGKAFHNCLEAALHKQEPITEVLETCSGHWRSIEAVLPGVSHVMALESRVLHPHLHYQGQVDCVAHYRDKPVLIEWKTSRKPKTTIKSMYDNPIQVAAYIGALNYDSNYSLPQPIDSGLLVAAYECGSPADVHLLTPQECRDFWTLWLKRLTLFWQKQKLIFPGAQ